MRRRAEIPGPVRSCIGCRARRSQSALVRITRSEQGIVVDGASDGRGAWLCRSADGVVVECLEAAIAARAFSRAWRSDVAPDEYVAIRQCVVEGRRRSGVH